MDVKLIECRLIDVPKSNNELRTFSKEFAVNLSDSIKSEGMYNPVAVRPNPASPGRFLLVQGKHRLYAVKSVLKEQFINCTIIADMDDIDAEMAMIAENLWRNPLTRPQHAICLKKWFAHWMTKNPQKVGRGSAGSLAAAKSREAKKAAASGAKEGNEAGTADATAGDDGESTDSGAEQSFTKIVAAATGQSEASATRTKRIAVAFNEDQLDVFNQMSVSQTDMLRIAKIKDEAKRGEVVNLIASGIDVAESIKEVMGDAAPKRDNGESKATAEAKETAKEEKRAELTDDEWFLTYCGEKAAMLGDPSRFKADCLLYRNITDARHAFRAKVKAAVKATGEAGTKGPVFFAVNRIIAMSHPRDFTLCFDCKGKGKDSASVNCKKCGGAGFALKLEEYL